MRFLASNKYVYAFSKKKTKTKNKYLKVLDYFENKKGSFFIILISKNLYLFQHFQQNFSFIQRPLS